MTNLPPQTTSEIVSIIAFLHDTFTKAQKKTGIIAVSGGIDSALSLTLLCKAIGSENVYPLLLSYGEQAMDDSYAICAFNQIPETNIIVQNIKTSVDTLCSELSITGPFRTGNVMARVRMIAVFDLAKKLDGLVCGTENKSEHYLGYFTRFGDSASDIEPICHLYKTQVRQLVSELGIPEHFLNKAPSAGLWENQTDEEELGFTYEQADQVIAEYLQETTTSTVISDDVRQKVLARIASQQFKLEVPYVFS